MTVGTAQTRRIPNAPGWSAMSWGSFTHTVTLPSTTLSFVSYSRGACDTRLRWVRETSDLPAMTVPPPRDTQKPKWHHWRWRWWVISTKKPSISKTTTMAVLKSRQSCRLDSPICSSMARWALPLEWRQTFRRTTYEKLRMAHSGVWPTRTPLARNYSTLFYSG